MTEAPLPLQTPGQKANPDEGSGAKTSYQRPQEATNGVKCSKELMTELE